MEVPKQELQSNHPCRCTYREYKNNANVKEESWLINRHVSRDIEGETNVLTQRAEDSNDIFILHNNSENDTNTGVVQPESEKNRASCPRCHAITGEIQNVLQSVQMKRTDITGSCHCSKPQPCSCKQCKEMVKQFTDITEAALNHDNEKYNRYLELWLKENKRLPLASVDGKTSTRKLEENVVVQNKNREKNTKDNMLQNQKSEFVQKTETKCLKINKIDKTNTKLELNVQKQEKNKRGDIPLEIKSRGIMNQKKNDSKIKGDKTTTDNLNENGNTKQEKNITNNLAQNQKSKKAENLETNTPNITKNFINNKNELEENIEIIKTKPEKTVKQEEFQDLKSEGAKYTVIHQSKITEKCMANRDKINKKDVLDKSQSGGAKHLQSFIGNDIIIFSLPKTPKMIAQPKKSSQQKVTVNERKFKLDLKLKHSLKRNYGKGKCVKDTMEGEVAWANDTKQRKSKQQKGSDSRKAGDAHEYLQSKLNKMGIQLENVGPKQLLLKDLQPVDHLRGGGPQLFDNSKNYVIKNKVIDKNMNKETGLTEKSKYVDVGEEPKKLFKGNKNYPQQQQKNEQVQILKDILKEDRLHQAKPFTTVNKDRYKKRSEIETLPIVSEHASHKYVVPGCVICQDSELNLDLESFKNVKTFKFEGYEYVKNSKTCTSKSKPIIEKPSLEKKMPLFFKAAYEYDTNEELTETESQDDEESKGKNRDGVIRYALSNHEFIDRGWTILPVEKIFRTLNVYRMRPAHPEFNWFEHNKSNEYVLYKTGEKLADFDKNGHGRWYYKNGQVALDYYESEDINSELRIVIYSNDGEVDQSGRSCPLTVLAIFDYIGNGIVFDHNGKIRLKYNQIEGLVLDRDIGPISRWKWNSLTDSPNLKKVVINTALEPKDEIIMHLGVDSEKRKLINQDMIEIELDNVVKEHKKAGELVFELFQIKMKALKMNEQFSLRIMDQEKIHIIFRDGPTHLKLNIGMVLDNTEVISVHNENLGEILNSVEKEPADTKSLEKLQSYIEAARQSEQRRMKRLHQIY